jgi:hypothetical protein
MESVRVDVLPDAPAPVAQALGARHAARQAVEVAGQATLAAIDALAHEGYPFQDAATMLGLSPAEIAHYAPAGLGQQPDPPASRPQVDAARADIPDTQHDPGPLQTAGQ